MKLLHRPRNETGFTLIELLVVIVIIGILAAIAIPLFTQQAAVAAGARLKSDLSTGITGVSSCAVADIGITGADITSTGDLSQARCGVPVSQPNVREVLGHDPETDTNSADYTLNNGFTVLVCDPEYHLGGFVNSWDGQGFQTLGDDSCDATDGQITLNDPANHEAVYGTPATDPDNGADSGSGSEAGDEQDPTIEQTGGEGYYTTGDYVNAYFQAFGTKDGDRLVLDDGTVPPGLNAAQQNDRTVLLSGFGTTPDTYKLHFTVQRDGETQADRTFYLTIAPASSGGSGGSGSGSGSTVGGSGPSCGSGSTDTGSTRLAIDKRTGSLHINKGDFLNATFSADGMNSCEQFRTSDLDLPAGVYSTQDDANHITLKGSASPGTYTLHFRIESMGRTDFSQDFEFVVSDPDGGVS